MAQYMEVNNNSIAIELEDAMEEASYQGFPPETISEFVKTKVGKLWIEGTRARGGVLPVEAMTQVDAILAQNQILAEIASSLASISEHLTGK